MNSFKSTIDNKYHYLYKITNVLTNQYYYGIHSTYNLNDGYMGSGKKLLIDQKKLGMCNFKKEYIDFFEDVESLRLAEKKIITSRVLSDPLCYNIIPGGGECKGAYPIRNIITGEIKARPLNEEYDKSIWVHISKGRKRMHKYVNGILINKFVYEEYVDMYLNEGWILGGTATVANKIKINDGKKVKYICKEQLQYYLDNGWKKGGLSISCKGNIRIINSSRTEEKLVKPEELSKYEAEGWKRGSKHTGRIHIYRNDNEHKMIFENELYNYLSEGWKRGSNEHSILGQIKIVKDDMCQVIKPEELSKYEAEGWKRGSKPTTNGKIVINKNNKNKFIKPEELSKYEAEGWKRGSKPKIS